MNRKPESVQHSNHFLSTPGEWDTILYNYIQTCYHSCTVSTRSTLTFQKIWKHGIGGQGGNTETEKKQRERERERERETERERQREKQRDREIENKEIVEEKASISSIFAP